MLRAAVALCVSMLWAPTAALAAGNAFALGDLAVRGRVLEAFALRDDAGAAWLVALSAEAMPPEEKRFVTLFPRGQMAGRIAVALAPAVVAVDAAELGGARGPELLLLEATQLRILDASGALARAIPFTPPLPLPARTREQSRVAFAADWSGLGRMEALLPDVSGFRIVALDGGGVRALHLPVTAIYGEPPPGPRLGASFFRVALFWPRVARVDDDGDGRRDLIATTRYALTTYRGTALGLSEPPARMRRFPAFPPEEERRADSNLQVPSFADLDGDGDADLVVHRTVGTLTGSRAETRVYVNPGSGADPLGKPVGTLTREGGIGTAELQDLDGDGRSELIESALPFGIAQVLRILTLRAAQMELRVYAFPGKTLGQPALRWSGSVTLPFDFHTARVTALFPSFDGDWNGDGRRDLVYGDGDGNAHLRLAQPDLRFGDDAARIALGIAGGESCAVDLDGDGLDELVVWDAVDPNGRLRVARNLGTLPGSPPHMAPAGRSSAAPAP